MRGARRNGSRNRTHSIDRLGQRFLRCIDLFLIHFGLGLTDSGYGRLQRIAQLG